MNVKMYLYPAYMDLDAARADSRTFFCALKRRGVEIQEDHWDGTVEGLPAGEPVIVRSSSILRISETHLIKRCIELGHLVFYRERILTLDGFIEFDAMLPVIDEFLTRARKRQMPKESVIPYLRAHSKDTSTLGEGEHARRKAEMLLQLFDEHVLPLQAANDPDLEVFASAYPVVRSGIDLGGGEGPDLGFDRETIKALRGQIESDAMLLERMGLVPLSNGAYLRKLRQGLQDNLAVLIEASLATQNLYQARDNPVLRAVFADQFKTGANYVDATCGALHNTQSVTAAIRIFVEVLLPIVVERLVAAGYPDSTDVLEWDYTAPLPPVTK